MTAVKILYEKSERESVLLVEKIQTCSLVSQLCALNFIVAFGASVLSMDVPI